MPIDTLIFDLGAVLIDWNPEYVFKKRLPDPEKRAFFFEHVCPYSWNVEQDAGRTIAEANAIKIAEYPEWRTEIEAYYKEWPDMLGGPIEDTVALLAQLRAEGRYRLLALTNWSAETFPIALERYEFLHWFEGIVVSGTEKTRKPFPKIYHILLERYAVTPQNALFIDDNAENIAAAKALNINAIQFFSAEQLQHDWQYLDIVVGS